MKRIALVILLCAALVASLALTGRLINPQAVIAHGGGVDRYGCHRKNKAGNYHCHRGPCAGTTFKSQADMLNASCASGK
jgi:hypothetical protein